MFKTSSNKIKIFTDGANLDSIIKLAKDKLIDGITTNPSLMRKSGVTNYMLFAKTAVLNSKGKSISLEVLNDDFDSMFNQALILSKLGESVYVKVPITNSFGLSTIDVITKLIKAEIKVNITAILSYKQIDECIKILSPNSKVYLSIFAGRIADTGRDPVSYFEYSSKKILGNNLANVETLWASTREVYNVYQAARCGCDIITVSPSIIQKLKLKDYDLESFSLDTVRMFKSDADAAGYEIN